MDVSQHLRSTQGGSKNLSEGDIIFGLSQDDPVDTDQTDEVVIEKPLIETNDETEKEEEEKVVEVLKTEIPSKSPVESKLEDKIEDEKVNEANDGSTTTFEEQGIATWSSTIPVENQKSKITKEEPTTFEAAINLGPKSTTTESTELT